MKAVRFRCCHCRRMRPVKKEGQAYCGERACQRARKQKWSRQKYAEDPDYKQNQKESTDSWLATKGGAAKYHRDYRRRKRERLQKEAHSERTLSGSEAQAFVAASLFAREISDANTSANRDADILEMPMKTGIYKLFSANANRDAITVKICVISGG